MTRLGLDLGSRQVKMAWQKGNLPPRLALYPTSKFYHDFFKPGAEERLHLEIHRWEWGTPDCIGATGYGRQNVVDLGGAVVSEIEAHAWGSAQFQKGTWLVLDLGGQDTKVILVRDGWVEDFVINDKCAAGSGRYLENMAQVLGVDLDYLFCQHEDPVDLSTTCATYAESELISKIADGYPVKRLCAGVNHSTFLRLRPMLERWPSLPVVFVGGGARNEAVQHYLQTAGYRVVVPPQPEFNGALGCLSMLRKENISCA